MRELIMNAFLTLDGVMQAPGGADEDRSGGFEHGGWQVGLFDDVCGAEITKGFAECGGFVLGRRTYDIFAGYWPTAPDETKDVADVMNGLPKYVASRTLREPLEWNNSRLLVDDVAVAIKDLKNEEGKPLHIWGSGDLAQTLMSENLIDEFRLFIHPLVLGSGARLFRQVPRRAMRLVHSLTSPSGVVIARYRPDNDG